MQKMLLETENIGFIYQTPTTEKEALRDVSFTVEQGEFISLVGPSGCGKSTLLSILAGLENPTSGSILLRGRKMDGITQEIQDVDGNNIVIINDIRFRGKRSIDWKDVREYLKEYIGEFYTIAATGDVIYIGSDLPNEYSGSKYTHSIKGANAKAKANAAQGIPELIEIAVGKHFRENNEEKHWRNAKYGWYRYDSRFALPVYNETGEIERYNVFHASLIVRHSEDKKLYLYDILDIKKETSNPIEP